MYVLIQRLVRRNYEELWYGQLEVLPQVGHFVTFEEHRYRVEAVEHRIKSEGCFDSQNVVVTVQLL